MQRHGDQILRAVVEIGGRPLLFAVAGEDELHDELDFLFDELKSSLQFLFDYVDLL